MAEKKSDKELHPENYFDSPVGHIKDRIIINESPELPREGIFMSLNGYAFLAKPGVEIDLPRPVRQMLDTRIRTETTRVEEGEGRMVSYVRNIKRVTYTLVKEDVGRDPVLKTVSVETNPFLEPVSASAGG